ncbi:MAG: hypothetical protein QXR45_10245 [Candidatus Bathyarchaeia archaeon]
MSLHKRCEASMRSTPRTAKPIVKPSLRLLDCGGASGRTVAWLRNYIPQQLKVRKLNSFSKTLFSTA